MDNLKPCPFCGGEARTIDRGWGWTVECDSHFCPCYFAVYRIEAEAIAAWNTRADDQSQAAAYWRRMYEETVSEEIVRCRDCKYMHTVRNWLGMDVDECWLHADRESGALGKERTEPDGFCKWGERKEANYERQDD